jgi:hypothetical protein
VSSRHTRSFFGVMLAVVFAFSAVIAVPASAKLTKHQKQHVRKQLRKQIKKHPRMIKNKRWLKRASLVDFKLPVTIKLRQACNAGTGTVGSAVPTGVGSQCTNTGTGLNESGINTASIDLGPSLGQRTIQLGGKLKAQITFSDSFDGGALGNVKLDLLPGAGLTTSSIPLLWNPDVSDPATRADANFGRAASNAGLVSFADTNVTGATQGCGDFTAAAPGGTLAVNGLSPLDPNYATTPALAGYNALFHGSSVDPAGPTPANPFGPLQGLPGYSVVNASAASQGFLPVYPGIDDWNNIKTGTVVGNNDYVGPSPNPFPDPLSSAPGSATYNAADTVLRTNALNLDIAPAGTFVNQSTGSGPNGSQDVAVGNSGGQANLFGDIPGKSVGIDVTLSLATDISSIVRIMDQDVFKTPLVSGEDYPAGIFNCRQVWTGKVPNLIGGVHLTGGLRISPAITKEGDLRIAKATIASPSNDSTSVALAACLAPYSSYADYSAGNDDTANNPIPFQTDAASGTSASKGSAPGIYGSGLIPFDNTFLPVVNAERSAPDVACAATPSSLVLNSALPSASPGVVTPPVSGSKVSVAGDLTVNPVAVDVILGNV